MMLGFLIAASAGTTGTAPAAPTAGVVDDDANTFNWTNNPAHTSLSDLEQTMNGGSSVAAVTAKPIVVGDVDKAAGQVGVRVKAIGGNPPSAWLFNATDFTATVVGGASLLSATVENSNKKRIVMTYDALGGGALPKAGDYGISEGRVVKGNFPAPAAFHAQAIGYGSEIVTGTGNIGTGEDILHYINKAVHTRCRQGGLLYSIDIYIDTLPAQLTGVYFSIWDGKGIDGVASYTRIHYVNILSKLTAGIVNTVVFDTPLLVAAGHFTGIGFEASSNLTTQVFKSIPAFANDFLADGSDFITTSPTETQSWGTNHANSYIPLRGYMDVVPTATIHGDSLIAGFPSFFGFVDPQVSVTGLSWKQTVSAYLTAILGGEKVQNMGWSGQNSTQIKDRAVADLPLIKPTYAILEGGINNITSDSANTDLIKADFTAMFNAALSAGSIPVVAKIWGTSTRSNGQMTQLDIISAWFDTMKASTYPTLIIADPRSALGQFRTGGAAGNFWDLKAEVQSDTLHLNALGNQRLANAYADAILKSIPVIKSGNILYLDVDQDFSSSDVITVTKSGSTLVPAISTPHAVTNNVSAAPERLFIDGSNVSGIGYDGQGNYENMGGPAIGKFSKKLPLNGDGWVATNWFGYVGFVLNPSYTDFAAAFDVNNPTSLFDAIATYIGQYVIDYDSGLRAGFGTSPAINTDDFVRTRRTGGHFFIETCPTMSAVDADWTLLGSLNPTLYNTQAEMFIFLANSAIQPYGFGLVDV